MTSHLDQSVCVLSPRDQPVLDALRVDRDASGPGVSRAEVESLGATRYPGALIVRLRKHGCVIGLVEDRYQLGAERDVERTASTSSRPANGAGTPRLESDAGLIPRASADGSLDATQPTLFGSASSHYREAA